MGIDPWWGQPGRLGLEPFGALASFAPAREAWLPLRAFPGRVAFVGSAAHRFLLSLDKDQLRSLAQLVIKSVRGVGALVSRPLFDSATPRNHVAFGLALLPPP